MNGSLDLAIKDFNKAIELQPNFTSAVNNRNLAVTELNKKQNASH